MQEVQTLRAEKQQTHEQLSVVEQEKAGLEAQLMEVMEVMRASKMYVNISNAWFLS